MEVVLVPTNPLLNMPLTARVTFSKIPLVSNVVGIPLLLSVCDSCFLVVVKSGVLWTPGKKSWLRP